MANNSGVSMGSFVSWVQVNKDDSTDSSIALLIATSTGIRGLCTVGPMVFLDFVVVNR